MPRDFLEDNNSDINKSMEGRDFLNDDNINKTNTAQQLQNQIEQSEKTSEPTMQMKNTLFGNLPDISNNVMKLPETQDIQRIGSVALPFLAPEIKAVPYISNILSKIPFGKSVGNMLGRIGYGTALTSAPDLISNQQQNLPENIKQNLLLNAGIEGLAMPFRGLNAMGELFNPINYSRAKAAQIKTEHDISKNVMEKNFQPINDKYGDYNISVTPDDYLKKSGINRDSLYDAAQGYYDDFVKNPTYHNLINLKSQIGRDWARISPGNEIRDTQLFNRYNKTLDKKIKNFLSNDPNMLMQYQKANKYAENVYYPYLSTPTLKSISKGKYNAIYPDKMAKSIEKATNRVVGSEYKYRIPEEHPLRNHLKQLQNRISIGDISEIAAPALAGALLGGLSGNALVPNYGGGYFGGGGGLLGGIGLGLKGSKLLRYPVIQSPAVKNAFSKIEMPYYNIMRSAINANNE